LKNDKGPLSWLQQLLNKNKDQKDKKPSIYVYVFMIIILGVGIMMASSFFTTATQTGQTDKLQTVFNNNGNEEKTDTEAFSQKKSEEFKTTRDYEVYMENEMKEALEMISGVDDVKVVIYVDSTEKKEFERNKVTQKQVTEEADQEGGKRVVEDTSVDEQLVIIKDGDKEGPIVSQTIKPKVSGVLVVAKGAENIQVKKWIVEAVTRSLDVPSHRVSVMPKK
jgi:stage III sporulation protein AG